MAIILNKLHTQQPCGMTYTYMVFNTENTKRVLKQYKTMLKNQRLQNLYKDTRANLHIKAMKCGRVGVDQVKNILQYYILIMHNMLNKKVTYFLKYHLF